jgi:hypothetical protein
MAGDGLTLTVCSRTLAERNARMELLHKAVDLVLHLDTHLAQLIADYGATTHWILFAVVFCETGLVITPFLPGDSLLFAAAPSRPRCRRRSTSAGCGAADRAPRSWATR